MKHFCEQACRLASDACERDLSLYERFRLRLHTAMCGACRNYLNALQLLHHTLNQARQEQVFDHTNNTHLSEAARQRIEHHIKASK